MDAINQTKKSLSSIGFDAWIDQRTKYTPGQKFAYWEHIGVKYRLEIGPKEVESNTLVLSICEEVGKPCKRLRNVASPTSGDKDKDDKAAKDIATLLKNYGLIIKDSHAE